MFRSTYIVRSFSRTELKAIINFLTRFDACDADDSSFSVLYFRVVKWLRDYVFLFFSLENGTECEAFILFESFFIRPSQPSDGSWMRDVRQICHKFHSKYFHFIALLGSINKKFMERSRFHSQRVFISICVVSTK